MLLLLQILVPHWLQSYPRNFVNVTIQVVKSDAFVQAINIASYLPHPPLHVHQSFELERFREVIEQVKQMNRNLDRAIAEDAVWKEAFISRKRLVQCPPKIYTKLYCMVEDAAWEWRSSNGKTYDIQYWKELHSKSYRAKQQLSMVERLATSPSLRRDLTQLALALGLDDSEVLEASQSDDSQQISMFTGLCSGSIKEVAQDVTKDQSLDFQQQLIRIRDIIRPDGRSSDSPLYWKLNRLLVCVREKSVKNFSPDFIIRGVESAPGDTHKQGGFGKVLLGKWTRPSTQNHPEIVDVAIKKILEFDPEEQHLFLREAALWLSLQHKFILPLYGLVFSDENPDELMMVSKWMPKGTMKEFRQLNGRFFLEKFARDLAAGVEYIHSQNVIHGDLKAANVLISSDNNVQIADFGLSVYSDATKHVTKSGAFGSTPWMSAELFDKQGDGFCHRTKESDVYAFGCTLFELYTGESPWKGKPEHKIREGVMSGERIPYPENVRVSEEIKEIIKGCLSREVSERWTIADVLARMKDTPRAAMR